MKTWRLFVLVSFVMLVLVVGQSNAQILFYANFENTQGSNNIDDWERISPDALDFSVKDGILVQAANEVVNTTKTLIPVASSDWTDYTVAVDIFARDNDVLGLVFRYTDEDNYYSFLLGLSDFANTWHLNITSADEKKDWAGAWEGQNFILEGALGQQLDQTGAIGYTMAVTLSGDNIKVFFGPQIDVLAGEMPPELGEIADDSFDKGTTGLYIATCPSDFDNFIVFGPDGLAVTPKGKLAAVWGVLRSVDR